MNIKVQNNANNGMQHTNLNAGNKQKKREHIEKGSSINASNLKLGQDSVTMKRMEAQKKAMKIVKDAFSGDQIIDDTLKYHQQRVKDLSLEAMEAPGEIEKLKNMKNEIKESLGITDDSQEQTDLLVLEKKQRIDDFNSKEVLSEEEKAYLKKMGPLTEYQKDALEKNEFAYQWQKKIDKLNNQMTAHNQAVDSIKKEQVKTHTMVDAEKAAENIIQAASKEIVGILVEEAKDKTDEKIEEKEAKAQKEKEEEEAKKEKIEKNRDEKQFGSEEIQQLNQITRLDNIQDKIQMELKGIIESQKVLAEDIKGLVVDEEF